MILRSWTPSPAMIDLLTSHYIVRIPRQFLTLYPDGFLKMQVPLGFSSPSTSLVVLSTSMLSLWHLK